MRIRGAWLAFALLLGGKSGCQGADARTAHYVGPDTCALCHKDVAARQSRTAMATTWQGRDTQWLPAEFGASVAEDLAYALERTDGAFTYAVGLPGGQRLALPVDILVGGRRHGIGFLVPIQQIDGIPLARPALLQARYAWSPEKQRLLLAPGCGSAVPQSLEDALGLVLSPTFQARCLSCHGEANQAGTGKNGGVHCESCHGPGSGHLVALGRGNTRQGILNPKRLSTDDSIAVCAACHVGLTRFADPSSDDLLVANQVRAIEGSECFLQSGRAFSCTACHDPHNETEDEQTVVGACLHCHASSATPRAAICPVNAASGCTACHMPAVETGPLHLVDHLIRVHPEQGVRPSTRATGMRTEVRPVSEYLRLIATNTAEEAGAARSRLNQGESFYTVARETSMDRTASIGGYLGRKTLRDLQPELAEAAARLGHGEISAPVQAGGRWVVLQRLPRDFKWDAEQLQRQAERLAAAGDAVDGIGKAQEALSIYPQYLRALDFIGVTFAASGNPKRGAEILATALRLYPNDAKTEFERASLLKLLGDEAGARAAYRRVISLESDFTAAYLNLGLMAYASEDWPSAIEIFRQGLQIDPLSADLNYNLGQALLRSGDASGAGQAMTLARKLDPGRFATTKTAP